MAKKKKEEEFEEVVENHNLNDDVISVSFFDKNKNIILGVAVGLLLVVVAYFLYQNNQERTELEAQKALFPAQNAFSTDSLELMLNGDQAKGVKGVEDIAKEYSGTDAANLANFYAGVAKLNKGEFAAAIVNLSEFSSDDLLVQARAYSLIGDANSELGKSEEAIKFYKKAADYKPNKEYTPIYLLKLAVAYEGANKTSEATEAYNKIVTDYPTAKQAVVAKRYIAKYSVKK